MECNDSNIQGNLSTIILFIYILISPYVESLGITQSMFAEVCFAVMGLVIAIWSAYNPNTLKVFGNHKKCTCAMVSEDASEEDETEVDVDEGC